MYMYTCTGYCEFIASRGLLQLSSKVGRDQHTSKELVNACTCTPVQVIVNLLQAVVCFSCQVKLEGISRLFVQYLIIKLMGKVQ